MRFGRGLSYPAQSWGRQATTEIIDGDADWLQREESGLRLEHGLLGHLPGTETNTRVKDWSTKCDLGLRVSAAGNALLQLSLQLWVLLLQKERIFKPLAGPIYFSRAEFCLSCCMSIVQVLKLSQEQELLTCLSLPQTEFEVKSCTCLYQRCVFLMAFRTMICCTVFPLLSSVVLFQSSDWLWFSKDGTKNLAFTVAVVTL